MRLSNSEIDDRIAKLHLELEHSQSANSYPDQYPEYRKLSSKEHFEMWDEMWKLVCERNAINEMKSVGS